MKWFFKTLRTLCTIISCYSRIYYYRCMGITIGTNCYLSSGVHIDVMGGKIMIGNNVNIAHGTYILAHTAEQISKKETIIGNNVIIFVNSTVLPGIRIGEKSIIGAGSVVARDVPPNVVVMGNPARVIRYL
ncbi:MAG: acyltransferase [Sedimentisphaerales bacterium]|nr:acyltransferase [Sedimentisphaerales bacterium]